MKYQAARISNPDRIYFDIEGAKTHPVLLHDPVDVDDGGYLKGVRVAQNHSGVVRVVLEVNRAKDYSVFLLPDPYRLVVDVYGTSTAAEQAARADRPAARAHNGGSAGKTRKGGQGNFGKRLRPKRVRSPSDAISAERSAHS